MNIRENLKEVGDILLSYARLISPLVILIFIVYITFPIQFLQYYIDILIILSPLLIFVAAFFLYVIIGNILFSFLISVWTNDVFPLFWRSLYFRSKLSYLATFISRHAPQILARSYYYQRFKLDSNLSRSRPLHYFILLFMIIIFLAITFQHLPIISISNTLQIWDESSIWILTQLHIAIVSLTFIIIVFSFNLSRDRTIGDSNKSTIFIDIILIRVIVLSTIFVLSLLVTTLYYDTPETILPAILQVHLILFSLTTVSSFWIIERTLNRVVRDKELRTYLPVVNAQIVMLTIVATIRAHSKPYLASKASGISRKTTIKRSTQIRITAKDLDLEAGRYITDIDLKRVREALGRNKSYPVHSTFNVTIGDRILSPNMVILEIKSDIEDKRADKIRKKLSEGIRTEIYDPWFDSAPLSKEYSYFHNFIEEVEHSLKDAAKSPNTSKMDEYLGYYTSMLHTANQHMVLRKVDKQQSLLIAGPIFLSLGRIFQFLSQSDELGMYREDLCLEVARELYYFACRESTREESPLLDETIATLIQFQRISNNSNLPCTTDISELAHDLYNK